MITPNKIVTERCVLQLLQQTDFDEAVSLFENTKVREYLGGIVPKHDAYAKLHSWQNSKSGLYICVRLRESRDFIGIISITKYYDSNCDELSYQFLPQYWGQGFATETLIALINLLNKEALISALYAETQSKNIKSCILLEKLGFIFESNIYRFGEEQRIYKLNIQ